MMKPATSYLSYYCIFGVKRPTPLQLYSFLRSSPAYHHRPRRHSSQLLHFPHPCVYTSFCCRNTLVHAAASARSEAAVGILYGLPSSCPRRSDSIRTTQGGVANGVHGWDRCGSIGCLEPESRVLQGVVMFGPGGGGIVELPRNLCESASERHSPQLTGVKRSLR